MKLLAIDSNSIINRAFFGVHPLITHDGQHTNAIFGFLSILNKVLDEVKPDAVAFAFDLKAPTFRHKMYDGYKANRHGMPAELASQLQPMKDIISALGYKIITLEGYEADDILGTLASLCKQNMWECVIATGDRDSFQLVGDGVVIRLASTKAGQANSEIIDEKAVFEKYSVKPKQLIDVKALMGDTSDNIPGVAGVGEKTASKLISEFGSLDGVYENIDSSSIKDTLRTKLINEKETAYLSRTLAEICCTAPLNISLNDFIPNEKDPDLLYKLLSGLELKHFIKHYELSPSMALEEKIINNVKFDVYYNNLEKLEALLKEEKLYLDIVWNNYIPKSIICLGSFILVIDNSINNFFDICKKIANNNKKINMCDSKIWYRYLLSNNFEPDIVSFDLSLAGYLISPNNNEYSLSSLLMGRISDINNIEVPDDINKDLITNINQLSQMPKLVDMLKIELASQDMETLFKDIEMPLSLTLASMESYGFKLDTKGLLEFGKELDNDISILKERIYFLAGCEFNINSPKQLGEVLFEKLELSNGKKTKTGYSTDADTLEKLKSKHPIVEEVLSYRKLIKLRSTYIDGLADKVLEDGRIHTFFKQTETRTGRISSIEPNLQNIPVRTERGSKLREFFTVPENYVLIDADYSQIELRVLAHMSKDPAMISAFLNGNDIHTLTAASVFNMPESFVTPQMRSAAKAVNFGIVYGISSFSLSQDIKVSVSEADKYIKSYYSTYPGIGNFMDNAISSAKDRGYAITLFNRRRPIPELKNSNFNIRSFGERVARNAPIQGTSADIIKLAMNRVYSRLKEENIDAKLILQVHDELIIESNINCIEKASKVLKEEMENAVKLSVPLIVDLHTGVNWLEAKG